MDELKDYYFFIKFFYCSHLNIIIVQTQVTKNYSTQFESDPNNVLINLFPNDLGSLIPLSQYLITRFQLYNLFY